MIYHNKLSKLVQNIPTLKWNYLKHKEMYIQAKKRKNIIKD